MNVKTDTFFISGVKKLRWVHCYMWPFNKPSLKPMGSKKQLHVIVFQHTAPLEQSLYTAPLKQSLYIVPLKQSLYTAPLEQSLFTAAPKQSH
jgi:hypothetical protein